jgi:PIN domain nuclease of toxin-antitoxin system
MVADAVDTLQSLLLNLQIFPITFRIALTSTNLDFRGDPADELIAATSVVERIPLLTRDRSIRKSRLVPLAL